jgi:chloride channel protein, CIC family
MFYFRKQAARALVRLYQLRDKYIKHRNFLIFLSLVVGLVSGLAAVLLKLSVTFVERRADKLNTLMHSNWLTAIFPLVGTGVSMLFLNKVFRGRLSRGVGFVVNRIFTKNGYMEHRHVFGHIITGAVTVALGGSVGLESPIVLTGAAIGSNTARDMRLSGRDTVLLLACGTASGIAAIFNSPISGIVFVLEVFLLEFSIPSFIPLLISTATATVLSQLLYPDKFVFLTITGWKVTAIPYYILLGVFCGLLSAYVTVAVQRIEGYFEHKKLNWKTWLMAGIPLCVLIFFLPKLYGEGYYTITQLINGNYSIITRHNFIGQIADTPTAIIIISILLILVKVICSSLTVSAGGNGGIFAPSLFMGGILGFVFAYTVNLLGIFPINIPNFIIAAMAGVLAGVMHAPLTAIFLLAEITGGYQLFVPLMIVTAISYMIATRYIKHSIYHKSLFESKILMPDNYLSREDSYE